MRAAEIEARIAEIERDIKRDRWVIVVLCVAALVLSLLGAAGDDRG